jgi:dihydroorotate dehydrogenase
LPKDQAVINRLGLGNEGAEAVATRLSSFECLRGKGNPVGINIAKTHSPSILGDAALDDFAFSYKTLEPYADFVVVNVSCPNTAEGKTFEDPPALKALLERLKESRGAAQPPMLLKVSPPPDTDEGRASLRSIVEVAQASGIVSGYVVSNTAGDRDVPLSQEGRQAAEAAGRGGLSGAPLRARSTAACREVCRLTEGKVPIIGVGGIDSAEAAYERIRAGASLVEVYSGMVYKGPFLVGDIQRGLRRLLARDGFESIADAVGVDVK